MRCLNDSINIIDTPTSIVPSPIAGDSSAVIVTPPVSDNDGLNTELCVIKN